MANTVPKSKSKGIKFIKVNLARQIVEAFEGTTLVFQFECVTGDNDHPTERGNFRILRKPQHYRYRSHKYNVQMNYPLFFTQDGKAFHQYHGLAPLWVVRMVRNNISDWFGSHGCVRLTETDAKALFEWASIGTAVQVL